MYKTSANENELTMNYVIQKDLFLNNISSFSNECNLSTGRLNFWQALKNWSWVLTPMAAHEAVIRGMKGIV